MTQYIGVNTYTQNHWHEANFSQEKKVKNHYSV